MVMYYGFQRDGTVQLFGTKGQKFLHCQGTTGEAQNLVKGWDRTGQPVKIQDGLGDGTVQDFQVTTWIMGSFYRYRLIPHLSCFPFVPGK